MIDIEDTYCEAFDGIYCRVILTAHDDKTLKKAAYDSTSTPGTVIERVEAGIETWLDKRDTPDGRNGAILQFWYENEDLKKFELELSYRIRQDILVKPFTALFDASLDPAGKIDMMRHVGHCGDGFEWEEKLFNRDMIIIPTTVPDFQIERFINYSRGVMGANFWYMCNQKEIVLEAGRQVLDAIDKVEGVITPFEICAAASKPGTNYPWIGPTTNHPYCPSLKKKLTYASKVPNGVKYIPEIVINGCNMNQVQEGMKAGIEALMDVDGVLKVSAGNYEGKLGDHRIYLKELFR